MKKSTRKIPTIRVKELAKELNLEFSKFMQLTTLKHGAVAYKDYIIKETKQGNWAVFNFKNKAYVDQFYMKTCAVMAAKAYSAVQLDKFQEIKSLDNLYWASYTDAIIFKNNIKNAKETERYLILLNRLEESNLRRAHYQEEISRMFKWSFV
jgi:hypothetical protein